MIRGQLAQNQGFSKTLISFEQKKVGMWVLHRSKGNRFCYRMIILRIKIKWNISSKSWPQSLSYEIHLIYQLLDQWKSRCLNVPSVLCRMLKTSSLYLVPKKFHLNPGDWITHGYLGSDLLLADFVKFLCVSYWIRLDSVSDSSIWRSNIFSYRKITVALVGSRFGNATCKICLSSLLSYA